MRNDVPPGAPDGTPPAWLYDDSGEAIVHLLSVDPVDPEGDYARRTAFRGGPDRRFPLRFSGSGSIDHIALACDNWDDMISRLKEHEVSFCENHIPAMNVHQLFITDPNGVMLELNFQPSSSRLGLDSIQGEFEEPKEAIA
jgi:hypothetical protein